MTTNISFIYVYFNTPSELIKSIESIKESIDKISYEIIIVNNNSDKPLPVELQSYKEVKVIDNAENVGFSKAVNQAALISHGEYLLITNPDTEFKGKAISLMYDRIKKDKKIGVLGPAAQNQNKTFLQNYGGFPFLPTALVVFSFLNKLFPQNTYSKHYWRSDINHTKDEYEVDAIGGACMMIKKSIFEEVGKLDEQFFMYFEEADICYRIKKLGYQVLYYPKAKIVHHVGKSTDDKSWIQKTFEGSRFKFFRKYHGLWGAIMGEMILRLLNVNTLLLLIVLFISLFLNLYQIDKLVLFIGDSARDYLVARDVVLHGNIPLLGIPSSVVWLHQGPLSIYFISLALAVSHLNPIAPAILYGLFGVFSTFLVYKLGSVFFNNKAGLLAALFYATSPFILVNTRMPYHTSPIPLFASLFFLTLFHFLKSGKNIFWTFVLLGLCLELELSNAVLFLITAILFFFYKKSLHISLKKMGQALVGFCIGILPFILHDLTHKFIQTGGLVLWTLNRIRLFFGLGSADKITTGKAPHAAYTIWVNIEKIIFPFNQYIVFIILVLILIAITLNKKKLIPKSIPYGLLITLLWLAIPVIGYFVHAAPGPAYFPLIFPPFALLTGFMFYEIINRFKILSLFFIVLIALNAGQTVRNQYFLSTEEMMRTMPPDDYSLGYAMYLQDDIAKFLLKDSQNKPVRLQMGGSAGNFQTSIDSYTYLFLWHGGTIDQKSRIMYELFESKKEIPSGLTIVYQKGGIYVTKK